MKRSEIEARIRIVQDMQSRETDVSTLATLNRCLERLIMMDADDERPEIKGDTSGYEPGELSSEGNLERAD